MELINWSDLSCTIVIFLSVKLYKQILELIAVRITEEGIPEKVVELELCAYVLYMYTICTYIYIICSIYILCIHTSHLYASVYLNHCILGEWFMSEGGQESAFLTRLQVMLMLMVVYITVYYRQCNYCCLYYCFRLFKDIHSDYIFYKSEGEISKKYSLNS